MTTSMTTLAALAAALFAAGCLTDDDLTETELGEATQDLTGINTYTLTVSGTTTGTRNLGPVSGRACFLTGVVGDISISNVQLQTSAGATITSNGTDWILSLTPASGDVTARAACATASGLTSEQTWSTGSAPVALTSTATLRRCFLTGLSTGKNATYLAGGLNVDSDVVSITSSGGNFVLGGSSSGRVVARARCILPAHDWGGASVWAPAGGSAVSPLVVYDGNDFCGLQRVNGNFDAALTGTEITRVVGPASEVYWRIFADNGSGGYMRCVD